MGLLRDKLTLGYYVMVMPSPAVCMDQPNLIHSQFCCCACSLYTLLDSAMRYGGEDVRWLTIPPASSVYYSRVHAAQSTLPTGAGLCSCRKQLWQWAADQPKNMKCIRSQWWSKPLESDTHSIILEEMGGNTGGFFSFLSFSSHVGQIFRLRLHFYQITPQIPIWTKQSVHYRNRSQQRICLLNNWTSEQIEHDDYRLPPPIILGPIKRYQIGHQHQAQTTPTITSRTQPTHSTLYITFNCASLSLSCSPILTA